MIKLTAAQKQYLEGKSKVWKQMTANNEHSEVRYCIANFLNTAVRGKAYLLVKMYELIYREHERQNNLTKMMKNLRAAADQEMYAFIKEELGEEVYQQIYQCL